MNTNSGVTCFLPIKSTSQRVPQKNFRPFVNGESLSSLKLKQLLLVEEISKIIVSTDNPTLFLGMDAISNPKVEIVLREESLCAADTPITDIARHAGNLVEDGPLLWTHVTSPFFGSIDYADAIREYRALDRAGSSSLTAAVAESKFAYFEDGPLNFPGDPVWPNTQNLSPIIFVSSALFLAPASVFRGGSRISPSNHWLITNSSKGFDIDTEADFELARHLWKAMFSSSSV